MGISYMNKSVFYRSLFVFFIFFLTLGCKSQYEDISHYKEYANIIGKTYRILEPLKIYGITRDRNYRKVIDFYDVTEFPGISGPEVVTEDILKNGTLIQIEKVKRCSNCWFYKFVDLEIKVLSGDFKASAPILINRKELLKNMRILSPEKFLMID